ncbi:MAG: hypothetical protein FRX49_13107 [Trebouxia sp. A1-2]|nr:MAG: hypothetical protein FRX49_13107 [Trebouxia sp. A1-2]
MDVMVVEGQGGQAGGRAQALYGGQQQQYQQIDAGLSSHSKASIVQQGCVLEQGCSASPSSSSWGNGRLTTTAVPHEDSKMISAKVIIKCKQHDRFRYWAATYSQDERQGVRGGWAAAKSPRHAAATERTSALLLSSMTIKCSATPACTCDITPSASPPDLHLTFFNTTSSVRPPLETYKSKEASYASSKQNTEGRGDVCLGYETMARGALTEASATGASSTRSLKARGKGCYLNKLSGNGRIGKGQAAQGGSGRCFGLGEFVALHDDDVLPSLIG